MVWIRSASTLFLCSAVSVFAQACEDPPSGIHESTAADRSPAAPHFRHDVVALAAQEAGKIVFATGSLIKFGETHYLVTAWHFAHNKEQGVVAVFSRGAMEGAKVRLEDVKVAGATWEHFEEIDLSVLKLRPEHELIETALVWELPSPESDKRLATLSPVLLIGVPLLYGVSDATGVSPTVVRTNIANAAVRLRNSNPPIDLYLLPVHLPAGFSGGIVTESVRNDKQRLRGVVIKNTVDETGGQFSIAVPAEVLAQILGKL